MDRTSQLSGAIEGLYAAFAKYPVPAYTDPCLNCHSLADDEKLRSINLREAGIDDLRDYAVDAVNDWGDAAVFKHFLPRIYELFIMSPDPGLAFIDPEIMFSKFRYAEWHTWPQEEQIATRDFFVSIWREILNGPSTTRALTNVDGWLCSIAQCEDDISAYLETWEQDDSLASCLALSSILITDDWNSNPFWNDRDKQHAQLKRWLHSKPIEVKLRAAQARWMAEDFAAEFAAATAAIED